MGLKTEPRRIIKDPAGGPAEVRSADFGADDRVIDPVCFGSVHCDGLFRLTSRGSAYQFCSESCRQAFLADPDWYVASAFRSGGLGYPCIWILL
jgi:YHS domain-containing protein